VSRRANPALIGSFVLGGVLLAVIAVVAFGSGRLFRDTQRFISFFEGSVSGLDIGAPVRFRGIDVGSVRDVLLDLPNVERAGRDLRIAVIYDLDRQSLESRGAMSRLADPFDIDTLIALGVRAELATESLVTGRKYIALDLDPASPPAIEPVPGAPYPEIPTVNTGLERIEEAVYGIIADLGAVPLDSLVTVATDALGRFGSLASSPALEAAIERLPRTIDRLDATVSDLQVLLVRVDSAVGPMSESVQQTTAQATATMRQLESTLADVGVVLEGAGGLLEPQSPVFVQFERAMTELGGASRALRDLADYLERNPSALVRGRPGGEQ
jgi:paraquat-inducible protein B